MTAPSSQSYGGYLDRPHSSSLADVLNVILDKGLVIDAYVSVSLLGISVLTVDARIVVASVDTYLRFAEATNRLDLQQHRDVTLPDVMKKGAEKTAETLAHKVAKDRTEDAIETVKEAVTNIKDTVKEAILGSEEPDEED
ncbi:gas vesicle protein GvpJ [Sinomonas terrae]|uniref:Gas vesicle protein A n=1 Tax=Sinomonas terrae TaxID=2908838 RepID=A0ABS9U4C6_9MICC|nr:gas vesicle protein GvpJ [Sinomonas terrae]MCH6471539.1 gas vesicle protein [Sinomonas terrae]